MEKIISFKTAKLAKEKGFNIKTSSYYFEDGEYKEKKIEDTYGYYGDEYSVEISEFYENWNDKWKTTKDGDRCFGCDKNPNYLETFSAPTQTLLQKWLREKHNIDFLMLRDKDNYKIIQLGSNPLKYDASYMLKLLSGFEFKVTGDTYEEALEKGLQTALTTIEL